MRASWRAWHRVYSVDQERAQVSSSAACSVGVRASQASLVISGINRGGQGSIASAGGGVRGFSTSITRGAGCGLLIQADSVIAAAAISADFNGLCKEVLQGSVGGCEAGSEEAVGLCGLLDASCEDCGVLGSDFGEVLEFRLCAGGLGGLPFQLGVCLAAIVRGALHHKGQPE